MKKLVRSNPNFQAYKAFIGKQLKELLSQGESIAKERPPCLKCREEEFLKCENDFTRECRAFMKFLGGRRYCKRDIADFRWSMWGSEEDRAE